MARGELAVVTGASTGIGYELARCCAGDGYDLLICADEAAIEGAAGTLRETGVAVEAVQADLASEDGVDRLWRAIGERPVAALVANAGRGLGDAFLDQELHAAKNVVDLNVHGTISLVHKVGRGMRERGSGRILITGSVVDAMPGSFQAVYAGTKAFLANFAYALRNELKDTGVTVTCLMPGPTDTEFFERADMQDTPVGQDDSKADPAKVARDGYDAMLKGEAGVVSGLSNKIRSVLADVLPPRLLAEIHRRMAEPGRDGG